MGYVGILTVLLDGTCCWVSYWLFLSTVSGAQHANADGMSGECGQCTGPDCPVSSSDARVTDVDAMTVLLDQPFGGFSRTYCGSNWTGM